MGTTSSRPCQCLPQGPRVQTQWRDEYGEAGIDSLLRQPSLIRARIENGEMVMLRDSDSVSKPGLGTRHSRGDDIWDDETEDDEEGNVQEVSLTRQVDGAGQTQTSEDRDGVKRKTPGSRRRRVVTELRRLLHITGRQHRTGAVSGPPTKSDASGFMSLFSVLPVGRSKKSGHAYRNGVIGQGIPTPSNTTLTHRPLPPLPVIVPQRSSSLGKCPMGPGISRARGRRVTFITPVPSEAGSIQTMCRPPLPSFTPPPPGIVNHHSPPSLTTHSPTSSSHPLDFAQIRDSFHRRARLTTGTNFAPAGSAGLKVSQIQVPYDPFAEVRARRRRGTGWSRKRRTRDSTNRTSLSMSISSQGSGSECSYGMRTVSGGSGDSTEEQEEEEQVRHDGMDGEGGKGVVGGKGTSSSPSSESRDSGRSHVPVPDPTTVHVHAKTKSEGRGKRKENNRTHKANRKGKSGKDKDKGKQRDLTSPIQTHSIQTHTSSLSPTHTSSLSLSPACPPIITIPTVPRPLPSLPPPTPQIIESKLEPILRSRCPNEILIALASIEGGGRVEEGK